MITKYVFLTSASYSGSTLMAFILGKHSRIATVSELRGLNIGIDPTKYYCSCGRPYLLCPFWKAIETCMRSKGYLDFQLEHLNTNFSKFISRSHKMIDRLQFSNLNSKFLEKIRDFFYNNHPIYNNYIRRIVSNCVNLAECICEFYKKDIFFDASKTPDAIKYLSRNLSCEFKVIFLVRDGRAVLNSFLKRQRNRRKALTPHEIIKRWVKINEKILRILTSIPKDNVIKVNYNDLCDNPKSTLLKICNFIGIPEEEECINSFWNWNHHIIGNEMRLNLKKQIVKDDSWRYNLDQKYINLFNKIAGKYNNKLLSNLFKWSL